MTEKEETEKQNGLEKVLNYFPDASLYQFGLFIYWKGFSTKHIVSNKFKEKFFSGNIYT
jgi:hypothetical protein